MYNSARLQRLEKHSSCRAASYSTVGRGFFGVIDGQHFYRRPRLPLARCSIASMASSIYAHCCRSTASIFKMSMPEADRKPA
jgi:hypothetical protein